MAQGTLAITDFPICPPQPFAQASPGSPTRPADAMQRLASDFVATCRLHARPGEPGRERSLRLARLLDGGGVVRASQYREQILPVLYEAAAVAELAVEEHLRRIAGADQPLDEAGLPVTSCRNSESPMAEVS